MTNCCWCVYCKQVPRNGAHNVNECLYMHINTYQSTLHITAKKCPVLVKHIQHCLSRHYRMVFLFLNQHILLLTVSFAVIYFFLLSVNKTSKTLDIVILANYKKPYFSIITVFLTILTLNIMKISICLQIY